MSLTLYGAPLFRSSARSACSGRKGPRLPVGSDRPVRPAGLVSRDQSAGPHPALRDGDLALADSSVICQYLEERYPEPLNLQGDVSPPAAQRCAGWKNTPTTRSLPWPR